MNKLTTYTLLLSGMLLLTFVAQGQSLQLFAPDLLAYTTPGDINDMSKSSPLWPLAGLAVVGLGFIMLFQYKHRKKSE